MAGKINDFVTSSGFNELFSGYNQGFQWQIGCTLGSGELRWGALSLGMTEALSQKPDLQPSWGVRYAHVAVLPLV